ncbi:MAG: flagellin domain protein [Symbiobacteriaceae bacterium]|jgi:flagellin|nr:flagellin domain protein [Symbiobacteriaceae bacterium]
MRINTNVSSLNAWRNLTGTDGAMGKNLERLSSGYRINRAGDDVAGLAISENMRAQVKGLNQAIKNAQDGISLLQTAEGSLNEVHNMLHRMRELAVQSANGTLQPEDRKQIQTEMDNLTKEVTRITNATQFNSKDLLDGSLTDGNIQSVTLQIGPNGGQTVNFAIGRMDAASLGIGRDVMTGIVDNGTAASWTGGTGTMGGATVASATSALSGLANGAYAIHVVDDGAGGQQAELRQGATVLATAAYSGAAGNITLTGTGVSITANMANAVANGTNDTLTVAAATSTSAAAASTIVGTVDEVGAGIAAGNFQVNYDAGTGKIRLAHDEDGDGTYTAFGAEVKFEAGKQVTIGDENTAKTITLTLGSSVPTATTADVLRIASSVGEVKTDALDNIDGSAGGGVMSVGNGLASGDYTVTITGGNTIQLFDAGGVAIGGTKAAANGAVVTIGDANTGREVTLRLGAAIANGSATISVTNNEQASEAARFSGGVKLENSQVFAGLNVSSTDGARAALVKIDEAIGKVSYQRSQLGAITNRLDHTINNLSVVSENLTASESRIRDVDMALEMTQFTKAQILMQSGTAMLAQANQKNQAILSLLR